MTGLRDFHTSVFDFATKVMTTVESQLGGSDRSSQVTATIVFAGDEVSRDITISHVSDLTTERRRCVVVWGDGVTSAASLELEAHGKVRGRGPPSTADHQSGNNYIEAEVSR